MKKWNLIGEEDNKTNKLKHFSDSVGNKLSMAWNNGNLIWISFYSAENNGNGWTKVIDKNGEIWLNVWKHGAITESVLLDIKTNDSNFHENKEN